MDGSGNAVAVWQQSDGTRDNIWANRYTPSGGWGTATLIESNNAGDARYPQVAMDVSGNASCRVAPVRRDPVQHLGEPVHAVGGMGDGHAHRVR